MSRRDVAFGVELGNELPAGVVSSVGWGGPLDEYADMAAWPGKPIRTTGGFTREVTWTMPQWWYALTWLPILGAAPDPRQHFTIGSNPLPGALTACLRRLGGSP